MAARTFRSNADHGASPPPRRLLGLDAARVIATLGVVWFHSIESDALHTSGVLGRFSVAFYTMAAMVFLVDSSNRRQRPWGAYVIDRLRRLYLPFLGWSAVTVLVLYVLRALGEKVELPQRSWDMLVDGGTIHLWYVPFLLVASVMVYPVSTWMRGDGRRKWFVGGACLIIAIFMDLGVFDGVPSLHVPILGRFQEMTAERWSAVYWGVAAALLWTTGFAQSRWRIPLAAAGAAALIGTTAWQWEFGLSATLKVYGGLGLLLVAMAPWKNAVVAFLAPFGRMSAGVYFAHMSTIYIIRALVAVDGGTNSGWPRDVMVFVGATVLAFGTISAMAIVPGLQWLAGYDAQRPRARAFTPAVAEDPA